MRECSHPFATVVVCTLGNRDSLYKALQPLADEPCDQREILVVISGSSAPERMEDHGGLAIRYLNEPRLGVCAARNLAVKHARGELLLLLDDDVEPEPDWFHAMIAAFEDARVWCVTGLVRHVGTGYYPPSRYSNPRAISRWQLKQHESGWFDSAMSSDTGYGCNMAFRRDFLLKNPFPENLGAGSLIGAADEHFMFLKTLTAGGTLAHEPDAIVTHRYQEDEASQRSRILQLIRSAAAFRLLLLIEGSGLRWQALRSTFRKFFSLVRPRDFILREERFSIPVSRAEVIHALLSGPWLYLRSWAARKGRVNPSPAE